MGRPRFQPTMEQRKLVRTMSACGMKHEEIAREVGIKSPKTLRLHFDEELQRGMTQANARVAQTAYNMAISGKYPQMTRYWLACRNGWRERDEWRGAAAMGGSVPPQLILEFEGGAPENGQN